MEPVQNAHPAAQRAREAREEPRRQRRVHDRQGQLLSLRHDHAPGAGRERGRRGLRPGLDAGLGDAAGHGAGRRGRQAAAHQEGAGDAARQVAHDRPGVPHGEAAARARAHGQLERCARERALAARRRGVRRGHPPRQGAA